MSAAPPEGEVVVPAELAGERLDRALVQLYPRLTRSLGQKLIREGAVSLDGQPCRAADKVTPGQRLTVGPRAVGADETGPQAETIPLDIVYEDEQLLVVNKSADMVVHPARGHDEGTLVNALLGYCRLSAAGESHRPGIVHRLDQHTSGLLLVAKTDRAYHLLSAQIKRHEARRVYEALCWGWPEPATGTINAPLGRHPTHRTRQAVLPPEKGRPAVTHYEVRETYGWSWDAVEGGRPQQRQAALVECVLETGRTHQVRVHLAHQGHPLLGDPLYGDRVREEQEPPALQAAIAALPGQALHGCRLEFNHPADGRRVTVTAPPPETFVRVRDWLAAAKDVDNT